LQKKLTGHCRVVLNYAAENCLQGKMLAMPLNLEAIKKEIVEQLKPLDPEKVILFGSYAYGQPTEESDIDLYIVTKDDFIPQLSRKTSTCASYFQTYPCSQSRSLY
jgi:hypothetical protein